MHVDCQASLKIWPNYRPWAFEDAAMSTAFLSDSTTSSVYVPTTKKGTCSTVPDEKEVLNICSWGIFVESMKVHLYTCFPQQVGMMFSSMSLMCVNFAIFPVQKHHVLNLTFVNVNDEGISKSAFSIYFSKRKKKILRKSMNPSRDFRSPFNQKRDFPTRQL